MSVRRSVCSLSGIFCRIRPIFSKARFDLVYRRTHRSTDASVLKAVNSSQPQYHRKYDAAGIKIDILQKRSRYGRSFSYDTIFGSFSNFITKYRVSDSNISCHPGKCSFTVWQICHSFRFQSESSVHCVCEILSAMTHPKAIEIFKIST